MTLLERIRNRVSVAHLACNFGMERHPRCEPPKAGHTELFNAGVAEGAEVERARVRQIIEAGLAAGKLDAACALAFRTPLSPQHAISMLALIAPSEGVCGSLAARMAQVSIPRVGAGWCGSGGGDPIANSWARAYQAIAPKTGS